MGPRANKMLKTQHNMKVVIGTSVLLLYLVTVSCDADVHFGDKNFLYKQKFVLEVLRNIHFPLKFQEYLPYTKSWVIDQTKYSNYTAATEFFKDQFLTKNDIFTIFSVEHIQQAYQLFQLFYNSADWDTLFRNVVWARENVNEGLFLYAFSQAVWYHPELQDITLPSISEIYPYYFFKTDVLQRATYRQIYGSKFHSDGDDDVLYANYSNFDGDSATHGEEQLSYFTEDVDLNCFYYNFMMHYPFFLSKDRALFHRRSFEFYTYWLQQLIARYYLERQVNFMGPIESFGWMQPITAGFSPLLSHSNGVPFYTRNNYQTISPALYEEMHSINDFEKSCFRVIDQGYYVVNSSIVISVRNSAMIDLIVDSMVNHPNGLSNNFFLERFGRLIAGGNSPCGFTVPNAMMHFETTLRDPLFYQMYNYFGLYYWQLKSYFPIYSHDELNFKGMQILDVSFDKLTTFFEYYDADVSNALPMVAKWWDYAIYARQKRINHKPFTYTMDVHSDEAVKGVILMYMGPKYKDVRELQHLRKYFVLLDQYGYDFKAGNNSLKRPSHQFSHCHNERISYSDLYRKVLKAYNGEETYEAQPDIRRPVSKPQIGWPNRLLLPKGLPKGYDRSFYFIITASKEEIPIGFPFDRKIDFTYFFTKNSFVKTVPIYHED